MEPTIQTPLTNNPQPTTKPTLWPLITVLSSLLTLIIGIALGLYAPKLLPYLKPSTAATTQTTPSSYTTPTPEPTANWKTYKFKSQNSDLSRIPFSVKLPPQSVGIFCRNNSCWDVGADVGNGTDISFKYGGPTTNFSDLSFSQLLKYLDQNNIPYTNKTLAGKPAISLSDINPTGKLATFIQPLEGVVTQTTGYVLEVNDKNWISMFLYSADNRGVNSSLTDNDKATFDQILSTFKFLDSNARPTGVMDAIYHCKDGKIVEFPDKCSPSEAR